MKIKTGCLIFSAIITLQVLLIIKLIYVYYKKISLKNDPKISETKSIQTIKIPVTVTNIYENFDYIVITQTPVPTQTPAPTVTPTPTIMYITSAQYEEWFHKYAKEFNASYDFLRKIAFCESNLNPNSVNGIYGGLYQFSENTWKNTRSQMNHDLNLQLRFNPEEAIKTAAFKLSVNGLSAWPNCSK